MPRPAEQPPECGSVDKWHYRFLSVAFLVSKWSKDPSTKVGAVATRDKRVLSTGYNGLPRGVMDLSDRLENRSTKLLMTSHAETNVIASAAAHGVSLSDATVYITLWPCASCAAQLINAGVSRIVVPAQPILERWADSFALARTMLQEAGVDVLTLQVESDALVLSRPGAISDNALIDLAIQAGLSNTLRGESTSSYNSTFTNNLRRFSELLTAHLSFNE